MTTQTREQMQLHDWIDRLSPNQLDLVYRLVQELREQENGEMAHLLSSDRMKQRPFAASKSGQHIPAEAEEFGI